MKRYLKNTKSKKSRGKVAKQVISFLSAVVIFITSYTLVLPALTMDADMAAVEPGVEIAQPAAEPIAAEPVPAEPASEAAPAQPTDAAAASAAEKAGVEIAEAGTPTTAPDVAEDPSQNPAVSESEGSESAGNAHVENTETESTKTENTESETADENAADNTATGENTEAGDTTAEDQEETKEENQYVSGPFLYDTDEYMVTVSIGAGAQLPAGTTLAWREFTAGSPEYNIYYPIVSRKLAEEGVSEEDLEEAISAVRFFALNFTDANGADIRPATPVDVLVEYKTPTNPIENEKLYGVTFRADEGQPAGATLLERNARDNSACVEAEGDVIQKLCIEDLAANDPHTNMVVAQLAWLQTIAAEEASAEETGEAESLSAIAFDRTTLEKTIFASGGQNYRITVTSSEDAGFPADADLAVTEITEGTDLYGTSYEDYVANAEYALGAKEGSTEYVRLFDIKIVDKNDPSIQYQPAEGATVDVKIDLTDAENEELSVVHFADGSEVGDVVENVETAAGSVTFEADGFSVYAVMYTVDFHWEVNGKTYEFSIPGGGFASLKQTVESLEIALSSSETEQSPEEAAKEFVANVAEVQFNNPELMSVSRTEQETTVGMIKDSLGLVCEYSAELTEEQIAEINAQVVESGDWALICLRPFDTEESLTVTMKSGDVFTIRVTDENEEADDAGDTVKTGGIQIQKIIVDTNGNMIDLPETFSGSLSFKVYHSDSATSDDVKDLNVGSYMTDMTSYLGEYSLTKSAVMSADMINKTGRNEGLYVNDLPHGMYYISEVSSGIPEIITGPDGTEWHYRNSYILTEYPWRNHSHDNYRHVSPTYTNTSDEYAAVPEVLGDHPGYSDGQTYTNDYLEFYVYNVYEAPQTQISVTKSWKDINPSAWEATFRLQSRLVGETAYTDVRPIQTVKLSDSETSKSFASVPRYEQGADGLMHEIEYTVVEESYSLTDATGTYTWNEISGYSTPDEDYHYNAVVGETTSSDEGRNLSVNVINVPKNLGKKEYIDVDLYKSWDDSFTITNGSSATFELKRYIRTEYRDTSGADRTASPVTVSAGGSSISVQPGVGLYLAGNFAPHEDAKTITFSANPAVKLSDGTSASEIIVTASGRNAESAVVRSEKFTVTENTTFTLTGGSDYLVSSNSVSVLDTGNATSPVKDKNFSRTITLSNADSCRETFSDLISSETVSSESNSEVVYYYEYYLEETASIPEAYPSYDTGDIDHRIMTDTTVNVTNGPTNRLVVKKDWRGVPDTTGFPAIRFTLYWTWADDQNGNFGGVYKNYQNIELSGNNTTWICPEELPAQMTYTDNQGNQSLRDVQYYVIEGDKNDDNSRRGSQTNGVITISWEFYYYHNSKGVHKQIGNQGYAVAMKGSDIQQDGGTITICNKLSSYRQMDVQKQFFDIKTNASIDNITANYKENTVLGFHVIRAIRTTEGKWIDEKGNFVDDPVWMDYGDELLGGYNSSNTAVTDRGREGFWFHDAGGDWHFRIEDNQGDKDNINTGGSGLPCYGYYLRNGENIAVEYWYSFRETSVYTDLDRTPRTDWDWYSSVTPVVAYGPPDSNLPVQEYETTDEYGNKKTVNGFAAFPFAYTGQDPMRIANFRASDLIIEKEWARDTGASEVYVKVYRSNSNGTEDVTELIAQDIVNHDNWQQYVTDTSVIDTENKWLILSAEDNWTTTINKLLLEPIVGGGTYQYWIEEVAYKTLNGQIKYNPDAIFDPVYQKWEHNSGESGEWQSITKGNTIQLKSKGENKLKVINTASASSSYSVTKKYDGAQSSTGGQSSVSGKYPSDGSTQVVIQLQQRYRYEKTENGTGYVSANGADWVVADSDDAGVTWASGWENADSANPSVVTLPLPRPAAATVSPEIWYNSAAAWTYNWEGLDIEKDLGRPLPAGVRVQLYYRAVEVSTPGWFDADSTIDGTGEEGVKAVDDTAQTAAEVEAKSNEIRNIQGRTTLFLDKEWTGLGQGKTWPEGYVVEYQLIQNYHLVTAESTGTEDDPAATYTQSVTFKSVNMSQANAAGTTSDMVHPQAKGTLEETAPELHLTGLPVYGFLTATEADVQAAAEKGVILTAGTVYPVVYTYSVEETAVKKNGIDVVFRHQTVEAESDPDTGHYTATLSNELNSISVEKVWTGLTPGEGETATIQLKRFKKAAEPVPATTFPVTVSVTEWGIGIDAENAGNVTVTFTAEGKEPVTVILSQANGWSATADLDKDSVWNAVYQGDGIVLDLSVEKVSGTAESITEETTTAISLKANKKETGITLRVYIGSAYYNNSSNQWGGNVSVSEMTDGYVNFVIKDPDRNYAVVYDSGHLDHSNNWSQSGINLPAKTSGQYIIEFTADGQKVIRVNNSSVNIAEGQINYEQGVQAQYIDPNSVPDVDGTVILQHKPSGNQRKVVMTPGETVTITRPKSPNNAQWKITLDGAVLSFGDNKANFTVKSTGTTILVIEDAWYETVDLSEFNFSGTVSGARSLAARPLAAPRTLANPPLRALANTTWTNDTTGLPEGADPDKDELVDTVTFSGEIWSKTWDDLPKYADDGGEYVYYAYETAYTGATGASALNTTYIIGENGRLIVTNTPTYPDTFELTVLKVDEKDQSRKLPGAEFELNKLVYNSETNRISYVDNSSVTVTTANGGTAVFSDLTVGYYEIKEVKSPDGYIIRGDSTFYIKATGAGIQLVIREDGKAPEEWNTAETSGNVTLEALGTTTATATVTNEPGAALPSTGGPGTKMIWLLGILLTGLAGAGLMMKRRRHEA